jgi:hypothetical protein
MLVETWLKRMQSRPSLLNGFLVRLELTPAVPPTIKDS